MKKQTKGLLYLLSSILMVAVVILFATNVIDLSWLMPTIGTGGGLAVMAMGATTDTETMRDAEGAENLVLDSVDSEIADIAPYLAPLDTILRKAGSSKQVNSWVTRFYQADTLPVEDSVTGQDAAGSNKVRNITVANIDMWRLEDSVVIPSILAIDNQPLNCQVCVIDRTTDKLGLFAINTVDNDCPVIPNGTVIYNDGMAFDEVANSCEPFGQVPEDRENYLQKYMVQVEQSNLSKEQEMEVTWTLQNVEQKALFDLRRKIEFNTIRGVKAKFTHPVRKKTVYKSGGVLSFIENVIDYHDTDDFEDLFTEWGRKIFDGNNGSQTRYMFAGSKFMEKLAKVSTVQKQLDASNTTEVIHGITFSKIETVFGVLAIMHHQGLREMGLSDNAIVLDMDNIERRVRRQMSWDNLEGIKASGGGDVTARTLTEISCVVTKNAPSHAYIRLVA